jgi:hypothetical protein
MDRELWDRVFFAATCEPSLGRIEGEEKRPPLLGGGSSQDGK